MDKKQCYKCKLFKNLDEFYRNKKMASGRLNKCKECGKNTNRQNYLKNLQETKNYHRDRNRYYIPRLLNNRYYNIVSRSTKIFKDGSFKKNVFGKEFLTKERWDKWCNQEQNYQNFMIIYNQFVESGFQRKFSPSIDRINSEVGYLEDNLQWLTLSSNSSKSNK